MKKRILRAIYKFAKRLNQNSQFVINELKIHLYYLDFEQRESDIYIAAFPKSGTTWMQVILHNMLTEGDMTFEHIYDVSPWVSNDAFLGKTAERVNALPNPRILKTHERYTFFDKRVKGRFIHIYRDGKDVAESFFHHNRNYVNPELTFEKNFEEHFVKGVGKTKGTWFSYNQAWFENKNHLPILYVSYEQLKLDFDATIKTIAQFLKVELTDVAMDRIRSNASFAYMKEHETKFGVKAPKQLVFDNFIRSGKVGEGEQRMDQNQRKFYDERLKTTIEPHLHKLNR